MDFSSKVGSKQHFGMTDFHKLISTFIKALSPELVQKGFTTKIVKSLTYQKLLKIY